MDEGGIESLAGSEILMRRSLFQSFVIAPCHSRTEKVNLASCLPLIRDQVSAYLKSVANRVMSMKGESDAMTIPAAVDLISGNATRRPFRICIRDFATTAPERNRY